MILRARLRPIPKMYVSPISTFFSRGRSTPEIRAIYQPCRCLCLGLRLQIIRITPFRLTTLQCSQMGFTLVRTFTETPRPTVPKKNFRGEPNSNERVELLQVELPSSFSVRQRRFRR